MIKHRRTVHSITHMDFNDNSIIFTGTNGSIVLKSYRKGTYHIEYNMNDYTPGKELRDISENFYRDQLTKMDAEECPFILDKETDTEFIITCSNDKLVLGRADGLLTVYHKGDIVHGGIIGSADTVLPRFPMRVLGANGDKTRARFNFRMDDDDRFYGLGDKSGNLNKRGRRFRMDNRDALGYNASFTDPLYKSVPFFIKQNAKNDLYSGIFFPAASVNNIDLGLESCYFYSVEMTGGPFSYVVFTGDSTWDILERYTWLTGRPALPPLYTFGFLGSSMNYVEDDDADAKVHEYFDRIEKYNIPCEGFYFSSGFLRADNGERYTFRWNKKKFPDPKRSMEAFRERGYHIACNIKPGFLITHPKYDELDKKGYFIKDRDGGSYVEFYWGNNASFIDLVNPEALAWWKIQLKENFIDYSVSGIWNDNNELELEDEVLQAQKIRSTYPILMAKASFDLYSQLNPGKRPWVISRSGGAGIQKYARTWTGDNVSDYESMKYNQMMGLGLGLSGVPYYGHDIGGFFGSHPDTKQFIRWCQSAVFQPRFVIHSWNEDGNPTELWSYMDSIDILREIVVLHYVFMPYIYNLAIEASLTGKPMERSLSLVFPGDKNIDPDTIHYMFGDDILVLSAVEEDKDRVTCYLPKNTRWLNPGTGEILNGGEVYEIDYPYNGVGYLQKFGSAVVTSPGCRKLNTGIFPDLNISIIPEKHKTFTRFYTEDNGIDNFKKGSYNRYSIEVDYVNEVGIIKIIRLAKGCDLEVITREISIELPNAFCFTNSCDNRVVFDKVPRDFTLTFKKR